MFCKIFGEGDSQILVIRSVNQTGEAIVNINFEEITYAGGQDRGLVCVSVSFPSLKDAQAALERIGEDEAREVVADWKQRLAETLIAEEQQVARLNGQEH
jgi:hypothetical protein